MLKKSVIFFQLLILCWFFSARADVLTIRADAPASYVVKKGDTLWDISAIYLDKPWLWPSLWQMNPQIDNPDLIYPGDVLSLVYDSEGRPRLMINNNVRRLSPKERIVYKDADAITTLPLHMVQQFLSYQQALSQAQIDGLPYILGADANVKMISQNHIIYAKGLLDVGALYGIYRQGRPYIDPVTKAHLGFETILIGSARATRSGNLASDSQPAEAASLDVLTVTREIKQGDKLLAATNFNAFPAVFVMQKFDAAIEGELIDTPSKLREVSKWDLVVINKGAVHQLSAGHMLGVYRQSPAVIDASNGPVYLEDANRLQKASRHIGDGGIKIPSEKVGELMIVSVAEHVSFAIITKTHRPIRIGDSISRL